ncbi:MAG: hypothetical protein BGO04_01980 [Microbacterium sp. 70-38]|nr:MAG: hypothetical protein BGO04_01980 [Microbacterium sp. 70-38]
MIFFVSVSCFVLCGAALAVTGWVIGRRYPAATVTAMFDRLMADRVIRVAIVVIWWWLGWHASAPDRVSA